MTINNFCSELWRALLISTCYDQRRWLQDRGSLTKRIQNRCDHFFVKPVFQSFSKVYDDELQIIGVRRDELAMVREVFLYCGDTPVVFAHSAVARKNLRGAWRALNGLGNKSLGTMLFSNPRITRTLLNLEKSGKDIFFMTERVLLCKISRLIYGHGVHYLLCTDSRFW